MLTQFIQHVFLKMHVHTQALIVHLLKKKKKE